MGWPGSMEKWNSLMTVWCMAYHHTVKPPESGQPRADLINWLRSPRSGRPRCSAKRTRPIALSESSRTDMNDRLPRASLGRVEGGEGFLEGRDVADVRPQPSVPHPLDDLVQLSTIGL